MPAAVENALFSRWIARLCQIVQDNVGLLLVAASQLFMALMNAGVKILNSLDRPVPALEVRTLSPDPPRTSSHRLTPCSSCLCGW